MTKNYRFDFVFSYWIFVWFLLYWIFGSRYFVSPFLALLFAFVENMFLFFTMVYYQVHLYELVFFLIVNFFIKILPLLYFLSSSSPFSVSSVFTQFAWTLVLFLIYYLWIRFHGITALSYYSNFRRGLAHRSVVHMMPGTRILLQDFFR